MARSTLDRVSAWLGARRRFQECRLGAGIPRSFGSDNTAFMAACRREEPSLFCILDQSFCREFAI